MTRSDVIETRGTHTDAKRCVLLKVKQALARAEPCMRVLELSVSLVVSALG